MDSEKLIKIIEPKVITNNDQYWAMHALSFLEYFYEHKNSEVSFSRNIDSSKAPITMASLRAHASISFISDMRRYFRNWGLQYLLAHYMRTVEAEDTVGDLLAYLSDIHNIDLVQDLKWYGWYVTGSDSRSGNRFIQEVDAPLLGTHNLSLNEYRRAKDTDMCLLLGYDCDEPKSGNIEHYEISVLGEVEGKYSSDIHRASYWNRKPEFSQFGIGVSDENDHNQIEVVKSENGAKPVITFSSKDNVVRDFIDILDVFDWVFNRRYSQENTPPRSYINIGLGNTIKYLIESWNDPVYEVIRELRKLINVSDKSKEDTNEITMPSVPKIILP